jgi:hypothetical protein
VKGIRELPRDLVCDQICVLELERRSLYVTGRSCTRAAAARCRRTQLNADALLHRTRPSRLPPVCRPVAQNVASVSTSPRVVKSNVAPELNGRYAPRVDFFEVLVQPPENLLSFRIAKLLLELLKGEMDDVVVMNFLWSNIGTEFKPDAVQ